MSTMNQNITFQRALVWRVEVIGHITTGVSISTACALAKVARATFYRHYNKDDYFRREVDCAKSLAEKSLIKIVIESGDWRAAAWFLSKHAPEDWGSVKDRLRLAGCTCGARKYVTGNYWS